MIDYWCNAFTPDREPLWRRVIAEGGLAIRLGARDEDRFASPADMVARMDRLGIDTLVLPFCDLDDDAPLDDYAHYALRPSELEELGTSWPGRFVGVYSIDPGAGRADVAVADTVSAASWCVGLHSHTHSWDRPFDHADYLPYYEVCRRHRLPFVMQAGASGGHFAHETGHPTAIAGPAGDFAEVTFVLSHTGAPWVDETIAMATRFANVVIGTATHPPRRWPAELLDFLLGAGRDQVVFGTGFPLVGHGHALDQLDRLGLPDEVRHGLLDGTARRIFGPIPEPRGG
jgi:predicted TIM-barrel fold metal-dependent hydrolase